MTIDLDGWSEQVRARWVPLRDQCAFAVRRGDRVAGLRGDVRLEVGSAFKAFVAAEYARQVSTGRTDPATELTIEPADRVDGSLALEALPDGGTVSLQEAAEAMIGVSDNTATDLVLREVGPDNVRVLLRELGMHETSIPDSVGSIYERARVEPGWTPVACLTTMNELAGFWRAVARERVLGDATDAFLEIMRAEDVQQGTTWPAGVTCYRKSGMLEPPPQLAMGMGGALVDADGVVTSFAFALSVAFPEDAAYEDSPLEPIVRVFSEGLRRGLDELAGA